jgi:Transposase and inactivated derivatives
MLSLPTSVRIYLAAEPVDMRLGFDGLAARVERRGHDVYSGHLFVFIGRRTDRVKILTWSRGGFVLWYKRLERGRFRWPRIDADQSCVALDAGQLAMLLDGVDSTRCGGCDPGSRPLGKRELENLDKGHGAWSLCCS